LGNGKVEIATSTDEVYGTISILLKILSK
jgi:hypothetical protein